MDPMIDFFFKRVQPSITPCLNNLSLYRASAVISFKLGQFVIRSNDTSLRLKIEDHDSQICAFSNIERQDQKLFRSSKEL